MTKRPSSVRICSSPQELLEELVDRPEPAEQAVEPSATSAPAQAGLGHEAQGLADRVERALRKHVGTPTATERPS